MRRQMLAALGLVPALALGLPACGGDGGSGGSGGAAKAASDQEKMRDFAQCMRDNGVNMPDPSGDGKVTIVQSARPGEAGGPGGGDQDKAAAAQEKCRHLMPNGGKPPEMKPEDVAKLRAFSKCMRDNGISKFPDPDSKGRMKIESRPGSGINPESAEFKAAQKACAKLRPEGDKGPSTNSKGGE